MQLRRHVGLWVGLCRNDTLGVCVFRGAHHLWWWQCPMRYVYVALAVPVGLILLYIQLMTWWRYYLDFLREGAV